MENFVLITLVLVVVVTIFVVAAIWCWKKDMEDSIRREKFLKEEKPVLLGQLRRYLGEESKERLIDRLINTAGHLPKSELESVVKSWQQK